MFCVSFGQGKSVSLYYFHTFIFFFWVVSFFTVWLHDLIHFSGTRSKPRPTVRWLLWNTGCIMGLYFILTLTELDICNNLYSTEDPEYSHNKKELQQNTEVQDQQSDGPLLRTKTSGFHRGTFRLLFQPTLTKQNVHRFCFCLPFESKQIIWWTALGNTAI